MQLLTGLSEVPGLHDLQRRNPDGSRKSTSHFQFPKTNKHIRVASLPGNGEPCWKICIAHSRHNKTAERCTQKGDGLDLEKATRESLSNSQKKKQLSSTPVLAHYSPDKPTKVSVDVSSYGLGGVLLQKEENDWKPVFYASRSLTPTEQRYAQVEKEALAVTWN